MLEQIKSLYNKIGMIPSIIIMIVIILLGVFILDSFTGIVRDVKNRMFDNKQAQTTEYINRLEAENNKLREIQKHYETEALILESKNHIYEDKADELGGKLKAEQDKLEVELEEAKKDEAITALDTDKKTRCVRLKEKLLARNIPSAKNINCEELK